MMDDRERRRLDVARRVTNNLRRQELNSMFPARDANGTRVVLAALPDDSLGEVFDRVQKAGGAVNVAVADNPWTIVVFEPADGEDASPASADEIAQLHPGCHIGLLVHTLQFRGSKLRCHLATPDYSMELIPMAGGVPTDLAPTA